jgi:hypothetical protein
MPLENLLPILNGEKSASAAFFIEPHASDIINKLWHDVARKQGLVHWFLDGFFMVNGFRRRFWDIILIWDLPFDETIKIADTKRVKAVIHVEQGKMRGRGVVVDVAPPFSIEDLEKTIAVVLGEGRRRFILDSLHRVPGVIDVMILDRRGWF